MDRILAACLTCGCHVSIDFEVAARSDVMAWIGHDCLSVKHVCCSVEQLVVRCQRDTG